MVQEYDFDAPVRILEKMMHSLADTEDQQVVVLGQVLAAEINIGYEEIVNTQVGDCLCYVSCLSVINSHSGAFYRVLSLRCYLSMDTRSTIYQI